MALSVRQEHMLKFIREFSLRNGYPPTIREIGREVGITSTSVVNYNLDKLEKEGLIEPDRTISRGLKIAPDCAARYANRRLTPSMSTPVSARSRAIARSAMSSRMRARALPASSVETCSGNPPSSRYR